jgi:hypothetical protein
VTRSRTPDPYAVLGLSATAGLTDDEIRAAWRRIAEATHPDREDGGDPARFALAAAAYTDLRTGEGRNEARATLAERRPRGPIQRKLILQATLGIAAGIAGVVAAPSGPDALALAVGAATWLGLTIAREFRRL